MVRIEKWMINWTQFMTEFEMREPVIQEIKEVDVEVKEVNHEIWEMARTQSTHSFGTRLPRIRLENECFVCKENLLELVATDVTLHLHADCGNVLCSLCIRELLKRKRICPKCNGPLKGHDEDYSQ
jgi:predicted ATPase